MSKITAHRTLKMSEFRNPSRMLALAKGKPVEIIYRQKIIGHFVPIDSDKPIKTEPVSREELLATMRATRKTDQPVLDYLKDK